MKIYEDITQTIGRTPLVRLKNVEKIFGLEAKLIAKVERGNPGGSVKDRIAKFIIEEMEKTGELKPGGTIIEPTSGNTGIGIAMIAAAKKYEAVIVMPSNMSPERIKLMRAYGARVVLTDGALGMTGAIAEAERINSKTPNSVILGQFNNPDNKRAHYFTTAPEIYEDTDAEVDVFVSAFGTGGTISGVGEYLKEKKPEVKIIGVEPADSAFITEGKSGKHGIQGIGAGFKPEVLNLDVIDEILTSTNEKAYELSNVLAREEGIFVGISSGAALFAAVEVAKRKESAGKNIVVLLADTGERYLSCEGFIN